MRSATFAPTGVAVVVRVGEVLGPAVVRCLAYGDPMSDLTNSRVNRAGQRRRRIARGQETDSERLPVQVSQGLKRVPTIIDKLLREPTLLLSRMQDIGDCRAIPLTLVTEVDRQRIIASGYLLSPPERRRTSSCPEVLHV